MNKNKCEWCDEDHVFDEVLDIDRPTCECLGHWLREQELRDNYENNLFDKEFDR